MLACLFCRHAGWAQQIAVGRDLHSGNMKFSESNFRSVISGRSSGLVAITLRCVLTLLTIPYCMIVRMRNRLYDAGWKQIFRPDIPIISVGNITTGGTGKTPVVALVVQTLLASARRPAIVSRGYRADAGGTNDELKVLEQLCPDVPHLQNADRSASVRSLIRDNAADVIVMDDGMQHRRLHRNLNIVLIDATNPFGYGYLLPRGLLREPLSSLKRADLILMTRCDLADERQIAQIRQTIVHHASGLRDRIYSVRFAPADLLSITGQRYPLSDPGKDGRTAAFLMSGIGNPDGFEQTCRNAGFQVNGCRWFPDHHHYSAADVRQVVQAAIQSEATIILTTQKDLVKLTGLNIEHQQTQLEILALTIEARFMTDKEADLFGDSLLRLKPCETTKKNGSEVRDLN